MSFALFSFISSSLSSFSSSRPPSISLPFLSFLFGRTYLSPIPHFSFPSSLYLCSFLHFLHCLCCHFLSYSFLFFPFISSFPVLCFVSFYSLIISFAHSFNLSPFPFFSCPLASLFYSLLFPPFPFVSSPLLPLSFITFPMSFPLLPFLSPSFIALPSLPSLPPSPFPFPFSSTHVSPAASPPLPRQIRHPPVPTVTFSHGLTEVKVCPTSPHTLPSPGQISSSDSMCVCVCLPLYVCLCGCRKK